MGGGIKHILVAASAGTGAYVAAAAEPIQLVDGAAPTRVKIMPMGEIKLRDGRGPFRLRDQAHAEQVCAATRAFLGTLDFSFDYNHAAAAGHGADARASGWCKPTDVVAEPDGIYATNVEWTAAGAKALADREYRFISPLFMAAKGSGDVIHIKNAALVNIGAIDLPAIAAGASGEEDDMDLTKLLALLGLEADASEQTVAAAIDTLKNSASIATIAAAAGLAATATVEEVAAGVAALKTAGAPDPTKFVPIEQLETVNTQLTTLIDERAERAVAAAIETGKLTPAAKDWGLEYFKKDETGFKTWLGHAPQVIAAGAQLGDRKATEKKTSLTADEIAACDASGISHADFLVAANAELAGEIAA